MTDDRKRRLRLAMAGNALHTIFSRIVASHPSDLPSSVKSRTPEDDRVQKMMEAALGLRPRRGPPPLDNGRVLMSVAEDYFAGSDRRGHGRNAALDTIIWAALVDQGEDPSLDAEARSNAIKPVRDAFHEEKEVLESLVSRADHEMWVETDRKIDAVVRLLEELGVFDPDVPEGWK
jgi:hypothetical protein